MRLRYSRCFFTSCDCRDNCGAGATHCEICGEAIVPTLTYYLYDGRMLRKVGR